jgi:hypothetical protein
MLTLLLKCFSVRYGYNLLPKGISLGLQDFAQTACYSVHHIGLLLVWSINILITYQVWTSLYQCGKY